MTTVRAPPSTSAARPSNGGQLSLPVKGNVLCCCSALLWAAAAVVHRALLAGREAILTGERRGVPSPAGPHRSGAPPPLADALRTVAPVTERPAERGAARDEMLDQPFGFEEGRHRMDNWTTGGMAD